MENPDIEYIHKKRATVEIEESGVIRNREGLIIGQLVAGIDFDNFDHILLEPAVAKPDKVELKVGDIVKASLLIKMQGFMEYIQVIVNGQYVLKELRYDNVIGEGSVIEVDNLYVEITKND